MEPTASSYAGIVLV